MPSLSLFLADFQSLEGFPLLFRWNQPTHGNFESHELAQLAALTQEAAARVAAITRTFSGPRGLNAGALDDLTDCDAGDDAYARNWLSALPVESATRVVAVWDSSTAIALPWGLFVNRWDDFCYPSSDDVTVYPTSGGWILEYSHYRVFHWGCERAV